MQLDVTKLSEDCLMSEINALLYSEWTMQDKEYHDRLEAEYYKRIEDSCKDIAK